MGQQQLLLIILGVIIVGIAVAVGINMFTASASAANRDAVASDLQNLASMAQQYYRRPSSLGGGNNNFGGWKIPPTLKANPNGTYALFTDNTYATTTTPDDSSAAATTIWIGGVGTELGNDGSTNVKVGVEVTSNTVVATVVN